ncbi:MAG: S8 family serine peptidase, partial [Deltaproteobacteria bacterium]|nr:S8 family serine peptidase [Deltaproteobacteria bacterium]
FGTLWGLNNTGQSGGTVDADIDAQEAWDITTGSLTTVVADIDTGVDYNHEDLAFNIWRNPNPDPKLKDVVGFDVVHNDGLPFDDHAHGTHCSGVIGAVGGNGKGMSGVNRRVSIMGVKFLSADGSGDEAGAIRAIDYAVDHGAKVLSNSWGGSGSMDVKGLKAAVARAESKGVLFVAAAGNESSDNDKVPEFPGGFDNPNVFAVAATDSKDELAYFSNTGAKSVHVAAPGVDVYSSVPGNKYEKMSGTSMACPHAAGAAALLWSHNPSMTYAEVKARLMDTADKLPSLKGKVASEGRLNIAKALASP